MSLSIEALRRRLSACMNLDARRLSSRLHGIKKLPEGKQTAMLETIAADLAVAEASALLGGCQDPLEYCFYNIAAEALPERIADGSKMRDRLAHRVSQKPAVTNIQLDFLDGLAQ